MGQVGTETGEMLPVAGSPTTEDRGYEAELAELGAAPLWTRLHELAGLAPISRARPRLWVYDAIRPKLFEAGERISAEDAERRALMLLNPTQEVAAEGGATTTLYAALQLVMPHESAPVHRHTPAAFRLVIEGPDRGASSSVDGVRLEMHPGDLVLTPNWRWHDHRNDSSDPLIWLDAIDLPLVRALEAVFFATPSSSTTRAAPGPPVPASGPAASRASSARTGCLYPSAESPHLYQWADTERVLAEGLATGSFDPYDGFIAEYRSAHTDGPAVPTMNCFIQALPPLMHTAPHRHTPSTVYHVVRGEGLTIVDGEELRWGLHDTFCVPTWAVHEHVNLSSSADAVLFSYSNRSIYEHLNLYREEPTGSPR